MTLLKSVPHARCVSASQSESDWAVLGYFTDHRSSKDLAYNNASALGLRHWETLSACNNCGMGSGHCIELILIRSYRAMINFGDGPVGTDQALAMMRRLLVTISDSCMVACRRTLDLVTTPLEIDSLRRHHAKTSEHERHRELLVSH